MKSYYIVPTILGAIAVAIAGGYFAANSQATEVAKKRIGDAIAEYKLGDYVTTGNISATVFGDATIENVNVAFNGTTFLHLDELKINDFDAGQGKIPELDADFSGMKTTVADLSNALGQQALDKIGMIAVYGYDELRGSGHIAIAKDAESGDAELKLALQGDEIGAIDLDLGLARAESLAARTPQAIQMAIFAYIFHRGTPQMNDLLADISIQKFKLKTTIGEYRNHWARVKLEEDLFPGSPEEYLESWQQNAQPKMVEKLKRSGIENDDAEDIAELLTKRFANGGDISIEMNSAEPVSFFEGSAGNLRPIDRNLAQFMARAKIEVD